MQWQDTNHTQTNDMPKIVVVSKKGEKTINRWAYRANIINNSIHNTSENMWGRYKSSKNVLSVSFWNYIWLYNIVLISLQCHMLSGKYHMLSLIFGWSKGHPFRLSSFCYKRRHFGESMSEHLETPLAQTSTKEKTQAHKLGVKSWLKFCCTGKQGW